MPLQPFGGPVPAPGIGDAVVPSSPPPGTRLYVVGDIHGCRDLLEDLHSLIRKDAERVKAPRNVVVYVGDYVDRGPDSRGVIDLLLKAPLAGFERVHLKGNHEEEMLRFLKDEAPRFDWLQFGGVATLHSYGVRAPTGLGRMRKSLIDNLPPEHLAFYENLLLSYVEGDFMMVHAGVRPGVPLDIQDEDDLVWIREPFLNSEMAFGKVVVHGHTITEQPQIRSNRIGIDTGAFKYGRLTCAVLQGGELEFLQT